MGLQFTFVKREVSAGKRNGFQIKNHRLSTIGIEIREPMLRILSDDDVRLLLPDKLNELSLGLEIGVDVPIVELEEADIHAENLSGLFDLGPALRPAQENRSLRNVASLGVLG